MPKRKSCGSVLRSGLPPLDPMRSINLPIAPLIHQAGRRPDRKRVRADIPIALAASQYPTSRDFVPWRFSAAGRRARGETVVAGGRKPAQLLTYAPSKAPLFDDLKERGIIPVQACLPERVRHGGSGRVRRPSASTSRAGTTPPCSEQPVWAKALNRCAIARGGGAVRTSMANRRRDRR
jgi:hypothetical protein